MSVWYKDRTEKNATVTIRMGMFGVLAFCLFADQTTGDYWYYKKAIRKFDKWGMYYESPRWKP